MSLDGTQFFYPNALEADGKYKFNRGSCTRQGWFDCSCCPTNLIRFIPAIPGLLYSKREDTLYVNLYAANTAKVGLGNGDISIAQETSYPWDGQVKITIEKSKDTPFTLKLRVPSWARNEVMPGDLYHYISALNLAPSLRINGEKTPVNIKNGYITITNNWKSGDEIELNLPMDIRLVETKEIVETNQGMLAIERGPLVYAIEEIDNSDFDQLRISPLEKFNHTYEEDLLNGVVTISNSALKAIPYYTWSNRGIGKMKVWIEARE